MKSRTQRRLQLLGAVLVAALAIVVVAAVLGSGGSGTHKVQAGKAPTGAAEVAARFGGIPQNGTVLGNPKAPLTLVEFADLKCPICREYTLSALPTLVQKYVRTGKLKMALELQHFVGDQDGDSERAARMALASAQQNKLWQFADLFYINQQSETATYVNDVFLRAIGSGVPGLNVNKAFAVRNSQPITQELAQSSATFKSVGFTGTPSFALGRTGAPLKPLNVSSFAVSQFSGPIDKLLAG